LRGGKKPPATEYAQSFKNWRFNLAVSTTNTQSLNYNSYKQGKDTK